MYYNKKSLIINIIEIIVLYKYKQEVERKNKIKKVQNHHLWKVELNLNWIHEFIICILLSSASVTLAKCLHYHKRPTEYKITRESTVIAKKGKREFQHLK